MRTQKIYKFIASLERPSRVPPLNDSFFISNRRVVHFMLTIQRPICSCLSRGGFPLGSSESGPGRRVCCNVVVDTPIKHHCSHCVSDPLLDPYVWPDGRTLTSVVAWVLCLSPLFAVPSALPDLCFFFVLLCAQCYVCLLLDTVFSAQLWLLLVCARISTVLARWSLLPRTSIPLKMLVRLPSVLKST